MRPFDHSINKVNEMRFGGVRPQHRQQREQASDRESKRASERLVHARKPQTTRRPALYGSGPVRGPRSAFRSVLGRPPVCAGSHAKFMLNDRAHPVASSPFGLWLCNAAHRDQSSEFGDTCVVNVVLLFETAAGFDWRPAFRMSAQMCRGVRVCYVVNARCISIVETRQIARY